ncbi:hypothetical protein ACLOJK_025458 [Asimina triloba]
MRRRHTYLKGVEKEVVDKNRNSSSVPENNGESHLSSPVSPTFSNSTPSLSPTHLLFASAAAIRAKISRAYHRLLAVPHVPTTSHTRIFWGVVQDPEADVFGILDLYFNIKLL